MKRSSALVYGIALSILCQLTSYEIFAMNLSEIKPSVSVYTSLPQDDRAIVLGSADFPVAGDGLTDDTDAIQKGLNAAKGRVIFLPAGRYVISAPLVIAKGTRLIGFGAERPELFVAEKTPAFMGTRREHVVAFNYQKGRKGNDTFYSSFDNINIRISAGNPSAAAFYYSVAQGCIVQNADIYLTAGNIGFEHSGSEITNVRVFGGDYAVQGFTVAWQFLVMECVFVGQTKAAFNTERSAPTLIRSIIKDTPVAFTVPSYNKDRIYAEDSMFVNIAEAVLVRDNFPSNSMQLNLDGAVFQQVPTLVKLRGDRTVAISDAHTYAVDLFSYGLNANVETSGDYSQAYGARIQGLRELSALPDHSQSDLMPIPQVENWKNIRDFGALGDGKTDDTAAIRAAIDSAEILYFPSGKYVITDTIQMKTTTQFIGLHPRQTLFVLPTETDGYSDPESPKALLQSAEGGSNLLSGIGFMANKNPAAVSILWQAGQQSLINDTWFNWRGTGKGASSQHVTIWVRGGGGVIKNTWIANKQVPSGLWITDTRIPGAVYMASIEHHRYGELVMRNVRHWDLHAIQTENHIKGEWAPDEVTVPIELTNCRNLKFSNLWVYQTGGSGQGMPQAIKAKNIRNITMLGTRGWSYNDRKPKIFLNMPQMGFATKYNEYASLLIDTELVVIK